MNFLWSINLVFGFSELVYFQVLTWIQMKEQFCLKFIFRQSTISIYPSYRPLVFQDNLNLIWEEKIKEKGNKKKCLELRVKKKKSSNNKNQAHKKLSCVFCSWNPETSCFTGEFLIVDQDVKKKIYQLWKLVCYFAVEVI